MFPSIPLYHLSFTSRYSAYKGTPLGQEFPRTSWIKAKSKEDAIQFLIQNSPEETLTDITAELQPQGTYMEEYCCAGPNYFQVQ